MNERISSKNFMVIGAGVFQVPLIRKAQEMGYRVTAVDANASAPGFAFSDVSAAVDIKDIEGCLQIAREQHIRGVATVAAESAVRTVATIADALKLPGVSLEAAHVATNKARMRECFARFNIPSPAYKTCTRADETNKIADILAFPLVVKPADSAGSKGVSLVASKEHLVDAFTRAHAASVSHLVVIEEFMPGVEVSVEAFVHNNRVHILALSDKIRTLPPYLLDTAVLFPSEHSTQIQNAIRQIAEQAIFACGIDNATVHMELIVTQQGPKVVELASRGAGFHVFSFMLPWVTGVDTLKELVRLSVGETPDFTVGQNRGCALLFPSFPVGKVRSVAGLSQARQIEGVFDTDIYVQPGDAIRSLTCGADRVGHIIAFGATRRKAVNIAERAQACFRIELES